MENFDVGIVLSTVEITRLFGYSLFFPAFSARLLALNLFRSCPGLFFFIVVFSFFRSNVPSMQVEIKAAQKSRHTDCQ